MPIIDEQNEIQYTFELNLRNILEILTNTQYTRQALFILLKFSKNSLLFPSVSAVNQCKLTSRFTNDANS